MLLSSRGGNVGTNQHPEKKKKKKGKKEQKSKLGGEIVGSCRQRSCCAEDGVV